MKLNRSISRPMNFPGTGRIIRLCLFLLILMVSSVSGADIPDLFRPSGITQQAVSAAPHDRVMVSADMSLILPESQHAWMRAGLPDATVVFTRTGGERRGPDDFTWTGKVEGDELSTVVMTVVDGMMFGHIDVNGQVYEIAPEGSGYVITRLDGANEVPLQDDTVVPPAGIEATGFPTANAEDGSQIDVLVLYTQVMQTTYGSGLAAKIQELVDLANTCYSNSGITTQLRLVGAELYTSSGAAEGSATSVALNDIKGSSTVASLRDSYKADLVSLVRAYRIADGCGTAYVMSPTVTSTFASWAFSVIGVGSDGSSFCDTRSFAHELGHNMGCQHDRAHSTDAGAFPYSYGYDHEAAGISSPRFGTVMSYVSPRISYFSTPLITYGTPPTPIGVDAGASGNDNPLTSADNARSINGAKTTVANFRVNTNPGCTYSINPTNQNFSRTGGTGSITVTAGSGCYWAASESSSWVTITSGSSGTGNGTIQFSVDANSTASARSASITAGGKTFSITQDAGCSYSINPTSKSFTSSGGSGSVTVTAGTSCDWTSSTADSWITIDSGTSGSGNGTVSYSVAANSSTSSRTGYLTIGGRTHTVSQAGVGGTTCSYAVSPSAVAVGFDGGTGSVGVTTTSGCSWTATSGSSWITVTSGSSGTGSGTVGYSVAANPEVSSRSGEIYIGNAVVTVNQTGNGECTFTVSPMAFTVGSAAGTGSIQVTTQTGCQWTASGGFLSPWLSVTSSKNNTGSRTVTFSVSANTGSTSRTGTITVASQPVTVIQAKSGCTYTVTPATASLSGIAGSGTASVTTQTGCGWTVTANAGWLTVTSGSTGSGSGTVSYTVSANPDAAQRSGILTIATGKTHTVTQDGALAEPVMTLPVTMELIPAYSGAVEPAKNISASLAQPIAFGDIASGGDTLRLKVGLYRFSAPADFYLFIALSAAPDVIFMVLPGNGVQQFVDQLIPWQTNVTAEFDAALYGDIPKSLLPPGTYYVYLAATPTGSISSFYFWTTSFTIP